MVEYKLEFVQSVPNPFSDIEHDNRTISGYYHVSEMTSIRSQNNIRYGGESPWTHAWRGKISSPDEIDALELSANASTRERIEFEVDRLMTMLVSSSATPNQTTPSDFEWTVYVEDGSEDQTVEDRMIEVVWRPRDSL